MNDTLKNLSYDKIKFNWNKNPIEMDVFLSFLTVDVVKSTTHLGYENGWTKLCNEEHKLYIHGGIINGKHYLNQIEYGTKLANTFNNFVNPFYIFDFLNDNGKKFFIQYYLDDIMEIKRSLQQSVDFYMEKIISMNKQIEGINSDIIKNYFLFH